MIKVLNIGPKNARTFDMEIIKKPAFIKVYHPSCGHCNNMKPAWNNLTKTLKNNYKGNTSLFNIHADALANIKTPALQSINGFPTLKIIKNGNTSIDYNGNRSYNDMLNFCLKNLDINKILNVYKGGKKTKRKIRKSKKIRKIKKTRKRKTIKI